jgi:nitrite reductase/ring-hydroxylating ferredoxin subunit
MMNNPARHRVCCVDELPPGQRKIVEVGEKSIGVFNISGKFLAVLNVCPHELAPVCAGSLTGVTHFLAPGSIQYSRDGQILRCPWHGWEFDLLTGQCLVDKRKLKRFEVRVEAGIIYIEL